MQSLYRLKDMSPAHQELPQPHTRFSLNTKDRSAKSELSPLEELKKVSMRKSQLSIILESGILFNTNSTQHFNTLQLYLPNIKVIKSTIAKLKM